MKKKLTILLLILLGGCTVTLVSVRKSDNTTISTEANRDSLEVGNAELDLDFGKRKDSIKMIH